MLKIDDVQGVIFDVDDTLLNNYPPKFPFGLHERSRLKAAQEVGKRHGIQKLIKFTDEQAFQAFNDAPEHSLNGAVWQMLIMAEAAQGEIDLAHPLLLEIVELKDRQHEDVLRKHGREVAGACAFVARLADRGFKDNMAVASTAYRRDILVFFEMADLHRFFPDHRIISRENFTHPKPHPEAFETALKTLSFKDKSKILAFEDDPRGIVSAKAAGLFTCAITTRFSKKDLAGLAVPPDVVAESYDEFAKFLALDR